MSANTLTWNEALSGVFGSISLAAWIFLLVPQLFENYQQGSADGISLTFLFIWFLGDITNLAGALWAGLVPTVVALAIYFCFADVILILQCLYYNARKRRAGVPAPEHDVLQEEEGTVTENTALLNGSAKPPGPSASAPPRRRLTDITNENMGLPGSRRRSSALSRQRTNEDIAEELSQSAESTSRAREWVKNVVSILLVMLVGAGGWAIAWKTGVWKPTPTGDGASEESTPIGAEILGYASAICYLGARIPQIVKNQRERSCDGLSLLFFLLSLMGNTTYGAGILFHSVEKQYFLTNLPWLIGSLGTIAEDAIIFVQFSIFGERQKDSAVE